MARHVLQCCQSLRGCQRAWEDKWLCLLVVGHERMVAGPRQSEVKDSIVGAVQGLAAEPSLDCHVALGGHCFCLRGVHRAGREPAVLCSGQHARAQRGSEEC